MNNQAFERATRSIKCLPFKRKFYEEVKLLGMSSREIVEKQNWEEFVFAPFGKERAARHFEWMIKIGILRKEVDGQGLTDKVRLTPLGEQVVAQWRGEIPRAGIRERIWENFRRHSL